MSGAFSSLPEIVEKRLSERNVGFGSISGAEGTAEENLLAQAATKDFIEFGLEPEFIGRLPVRVALDDLGEDELFEILKNSEGSILRQYRESFRSYGIQVAFDDKALRSIAAKAHSEKTGARGLMTVLESSLRDFKFDLPGTPVTRLAVTSKLINEPDRVLKEVLEDPNQAASDYSRLAVREFEDAFDRVHDVRLVLDSEAIMMAANVASQVGLKLRDYLSSTFRPHKDFLRKILERSGLKELPVTPYILNSPAEGVELWLSQNRPKKELGGGAG